MTQEPLDLTATIEKHIVRVGEDRGDSLQLHSSDLSGCDYATYQRIHGEKQLPFDEDSISSFVAGHAFEAWFAEAFDMPGFTVVRGGEVVTDGIIGHPDIRFERDGKTLAVIDITSTKAKEPEWKKSHALKTADYALSLGAPHFAELVICLGFGKVTGWRVHWFETVDWAEDVLKARDRLKAMAASDSPPPMEPPAEEDGTPGTWRCGKPGSGKSYCQANCAKNARLTEKNQPIKATA